MTRRNFAWVFAVAAAGLLAPARAGAVPIGTFSWQSDCGAFVGPCFMVENFSGDDLFSLPTIGLAGRPFTDVVIRLATDTGDVDLIPATFGEPPGFLPAGSIVETTDDLTSLATSLATLTFGFTLPGIVSLLDGDTGLAITGLTSPDTLATIDFTPTASVPEPGTLLLLTGGLAMLAATRRRSRP